jgi:hypothetical protein
MLKISQILVILVFIYSLTFSQNSLQKDFPKLNKIYQVENKRADYIIVIDQSGSMKNYWVNVKNGISALIETLPDDDYISILGFSSKCQPLVVPRKLNQASKTELISQIKQLPNPTGQKTDLYEAIDKTLDEINRPNSNELKFLFFITDFINDPPPNTSWNSTNIHLLKEKYERIIIQTNRLLKLYALQLPLEINAGKDYDKFANIFHTITAPIFLNKTTLLEWFERLRAEIEREKLRMIILNDLKSAIDVTEFKNEINLLNINSHFSLTLFNKSLLPLNVDSIVVTTEEYGNINSSNLNIEIKPSELSTVSLPLNEEMKLNKGTICKKYPVTVKGIGIFVSSKEITEFGKLNLTNKRLYSFEITYLISFLIGLNCWQVLFLVILIILILYYLFYPCLKPVWLFNKKNIRISMDINDNIVYLTQSDFSTNKKNLSFDNTIIVEEPGVQSGIRDIFQFNIEFLTQKPKCIIRKPKAGTYVRLNNIPANANYSFVLIENVTGEGNEYQLFNDSIIGPIDFRRGVRIEATKMELGQLYKLRIVFQPK